MEVDRKVGKFFLYGQAMSSHHSDQMFQTLKFKAHKSLGSLCCEDSDCAGPREGQGHLFRPAKNFQPGSICAKLPVQRKS